jgi:hypothetical protein
MEQKLNLENLMLCANFKPKETNFNNRKSNKYFTKDEAKVNDAETTPTKRRCHKKSSSRNSIYLFNTCNLSSTKKESYKVPAKLLDEDTEDYEFEISEKIEKELCLDNLDEDNLASYKLTRYTTNTESILQSINFELIYQVLLNYEELLILAENKNKFLVEFNTVFSIVEKWFDLSGCIYNQEVYLPLTLSSSATLSL